MGRNPAPASDGTENFRANFWGHIEGVDGPIEESMALVSFERRHNGGEFPQRVVKLEEVRAGSDDRFPTLVLAGSGSDHWLDKELSGDVVVRFGRPNRHFGSACVLAPGEIASISRYHRSPRRLQVLGAWQVLGASGMTLVTTSCDADISEPEFESVSSRTEAAVDPFEAETEVTDISEEDYLGSMGAK